MIQQARQRDADPLVMAFADAVMAIGLHASLSSSAHPSSLKEESEAQWRLTAALKCSRTFQGMPSSLLKLQVNISQSFYNGDPSKC